MNPLTSTETLHAAPARVSAIRGALEKLQMLDREGVLLVMPEGFLFN